MDFKYLIRTLKRYSCAYSFSGLNKSERTARWTARSPKHTKRCDVVRKFRAFIRALCFLAAQPKNGADDKGKRKVIFPYRNRGMQSIETPNTTLFKQENSPFFESNNLCFEWNPSEYKRGPLISIHTCVHMVSA